MKSKSVYMFITLLASVLLKENTAFSDFSLDPCRVGFLATDAARKPGFNYKI
ncbi:predicted protein [Brucella ceti M644/93/1]|uniref:Uncharacterized protein n=1 Tax=Brucella ceti M644/93/1 TaxID=520459 RepID=A0ABM9ZD64_9HYPH|nr:predicted protein [Brucella ceti M13/05/1]EEX97773.1 predicted protein [Brucella ceti M644/93/1]